MADQVRRAAHLTSLLSEEAFSLLKVSVSLISRFESIPFESLVNYSSEPEDRLRYAQNVLSRYGLWVKEGKGYRVTMLGLDTLALHTLVKKRLIKEVGTPIGIGKESDVYEALNEEGRPVALKLFRIGRISFRSLSKKRGYGFGQGHKWLMSSIRSAQMEEKMLRKLESFSLKVPTCLGSAYHTVVMEMKLGIPLYRIRKLQYPDVVLARVLEAVREIYLKAGLVNSDLSEFNILITPEHEVVLIDWPQALDASNRAADAALERDLRNIINYFSKKFRISCELSRALDYVKGSSGSNVKDFIVKQKLG